MKIGITLDMSVAFWANGMQQNIVFLYNLFNKAGHDCYYITFKNPQHKLEKNHKGMLLNEIMNDSEEKFDVIIIAGFDLLPEMYKELKNRNKNLKVILVHFGNKLMDDMNYAICNNTSKKEPLEKPLILDQVWTSPHYDFAKEYIKTYYSTENVFTVPYIWDSYFIDEKIKELSKKSLSPFFKKEKANSVCIFEPNRSYVKNCIIPLTICERFNKKFPNELGQINAFGCEGIRKNKFFEKLMHKFSIVHETKKCFFNNRWGSLDALAKFGSTIISHQFYNDLNYSHLEALYLGIPLIHNSKALSDVGYYYPKFDVEMGANQLKSAIQNHHLIIEEYKRDAQEKLKDFDPNKESNIAGYLNLLKNE
jgi:hypothetical protein